MLPTADVAKELGLEVVRPLAGGQFGATLVRNGSGQELVLKLLASDRLLAAASRGAGFANRLRSAGYPAPEYLGTGTHAGCTWTLQTVLPGVVPTVTTAAHIAALLELAERHIDFAGETLDWQAAAARKTARSLEVAAESAPVLAAELSQVLDRTSHIKLRQGDVVHSDFHHQNLLVIGDEVTGVFDWEIATPGDWRFDVVTLAFWSSMVPGQVPADARAMVYEQMTAICAPAELAFMAAVLAARQLAFEASTHPDRIARFAEGLQHVVAPWWQEFR